MSLSFFKKLFVELLRKKNGGGSRKSLNGWRRFCKNIPNAMEFLWSRTVAPTRRSFVRPYIYEARHNNNNNNNTSVRCERCDGNGLQRVSNRVSSRVALGRWWPHFEAYRPTIAVSLSKKLGLWNSCFNRIALTCSSYLICTTKRFTFSLSQTTQRSLLS